MIWQQRYMGEELNNECNEKLTDGIFERAPEDNIPGTTMSMDDDHGGPVTILNTPDIKDTKRQQYADAYHHMYEV